MEGSPRGFKMPIAFDAASSGNTGSAASLTIAHTVTGSNTILWVGAETVHTADHITGVTYNGIAMTRIGGLQAGGSTNVWSYLYMLVAPASGANNVIISVSPDVPIKANCASYSGALQTGQPDASGTNSATTGTSLSKAITTIADNCWLVSTIVNDAGVNTAGSNTLKRADGGTETAIGDSDASMTPPGSFSQAWTFPSAKSAMCVASMSPAPAAVRIMSGEI